MLLFSEKDVAHFFVCYNKVFNQDGTIKLCSRFSTTALILACETLCPTVNFGSVNSGIMIVQNISDLHDEILKLFPTLLETFSAKIDDGSV